MARLDLVALKCTLQTSISLPAIESSHYFRNMVGWERGFWRRSNYTNNLLHNSVTVATTVSWGIVPSGPQKDKLSSDNFGGEMGSRTLFFLEMVLFLLITFWWEVLMERAIPCNQYLSECLSQFVTPCCQQAAGCHWVVTTFDLTVSRKLHFYQLLVAPSKNLLFIFGVIFPSLLFPFPWYVVSPNATCICKRQA